MDNEFLCCGVDEAGRGPLAGDVYAAAVILPEHYDLPGLTDSKKLTEAQRERLYDAIRAQAVACAIATASVAEIDELNILQATMLAMSRAVSQLSPPPALALIDGNKVPPLEMPARAIVKGDQSEPCISAASILAKVARDRYMRTLDEQYPQYEFARHKGYGTALHYAKLREYGASPVHRVTFLRKIH